MNKKAESRPTEASSAEENEVIDRKAARLTYAARDTHDRALQFISWLCTRPFCTSLSQNQIRSIAHGYFRSWDKAQSRDWFG